MHSLNKPTSREQSSLLPWPDQGPIRFYQSLGVMGAIVALVATTHGLAPEVSPQRISSTQKVVNEVYGGASSESSATWQERRQKALEVSSADGTLLEMPQHMTVYGELGLDALVTILDAVGVEKGDRFLDIGSGDGMLVTGAAMLFAEYLEASKGIEILPSLHERSLDFQNKVLAEAANSNLPLCDTELFLGDIFQPSPDVSLVLDSTTLAVCFATTWSRGEPGRKLPQLSQALGEHGVASLPSKCKLVIIDGVLEESDGFDFEGQLKLQCPDTAPYSIARSYVRT